MDPVRAIFSSYAYNREYKYMSILCEEVLLRVHGFHCRHTDEGDIIYGFLVIMYGDYGTSPRSGWIEGGYLDDITNCINDLIEEYRNNWEEINENN